VKAAKLFGLALLPLLASRAHAQPDYAAAIWNPAYSGHWYTTGYGHQLVVIHDMEGYYASTISYFKLANQGSGQASIHYCVNGLKDDATDSPAGQITQMVREQYYAWHARCWNMYSFGTEHEGFVSNPAWYTEAQYQASALLQRHLCDTWSIPKDRNHIIGHNEHLNAAWRSWASNNIPGLDPTCNTHTDPGQYWDWAHFMTLITNRSPSIAKQPSNHSVDQGVNTSLNVVAIGDPTLKYQWRKNGTAIAGATGSVYALNGIQASQAGTYTVVITNTAGAITSAPAVLFVNVPLVWQLAYSDNFDSDTSANWSVFQGSGNGISDYSNIWAFDYSTNKYVSNGVTNAIPSAPNSGGTTRGLKLTVNKNDTNAATAGISLYPRNQSFSNNYVLRFDMWINYVGGAGGGSGSTEYVSCGLNHTGTRVNWAPINSSASDGLWFSVDGDGASGGVDYRAYQGNKSAGPTQLAFANTGLAVNGATYDNSSDRFFIGLFSSPTYESAGAPGKHWVQVELSQINSLVTWRLNNVVIAQRTNISSFTNGNIMIGYMDLFNSIPDPPGDNYAIIDNLRVFTQVQPPVITTQPVSRTNNIGAVSTFTVGASGTAPLGYQWRFNSVNMPGATNSSYTVANVQPGNAGSYSVVVTNLAGVATSANATLTTTLLKLDQVYIINGTVALSASGAPEPGYQIQVSSNLLDWVTIATLVNSNGVVPYADDLNTNAPARFYRVSAP
jgi:N-acetyl-anhydromuramyl-L-alanine amidase AmpD